MYSEGNWWKIVIAPSIRIDYAILKEALQNIRESDKKRKKTEPRRHLLYIWSLFWTFNWSHYDARIENCTNPTQYVRTFVFRHFQFRGLAGDNSLESHYTSSDKIKLYLNVDVKIIFWIFYNNMNDLIAENYNFLNYHNQLWHIYILSSQKHILLRGLELNWRELLSLWRFCALVKVERSFRWRKWHFNMTPENIKNKEGTLSR